MESPQWLLSYGIRKIWAGQTAGHTNGRRVFHSLPFFLQKGQGTTRFSKTCADLPALDIWRSRRRSSAVTRMATGTRSGTPGWNQPAGRVPKPSRTSHTWRCCNEKTHVGIQVWYKLFHKHNIMGQLTHKQLQMQGCSLSAAATDAMVLKHQAISIHNAD